jgi:hypothetical protein
MQRLLELFSQERIIMSVVLKAANYQALQKLNSERGFFKKRAEENE